MKLMIDYEHPVAVNAFKWVPRTYKQELHVHSSLEIGICLSGKGAFYFGNKEYDVLPGDIFIVNNREPHIAVSSAECPSVYLFLNFDPALLLREDETLLLPFTYTPTGFDNRIAGAEREATDISALMKSIYEESEARRPGYCSMVKGKILELCVLLLRYYEGRMKPDEWNRHAGAFRKLRKVTDYMEEAFRDPIGLEHLAAFMNLSPTAASRYFHELTGRPFQRYLQEIRLRESKRLLSSTNKSIADVCFDSGFQSLSSFYRLFKQEVARSPQSYRKQYSVSAIIENNEQQSGSLPAFNRL